jgi:hypothetical protein
MFGKFHAIRTILHAVSVHVLIVMSRLKAGQIHLRYLAYVANIVHLISY